MSTQASCRWNIRCAEVRSVTAAPPRLLGLSLFYPSFSRRTPGPRDHGALGGSQKDIGPPRFPQHGACCSFKKSQASCRRNIRCAEVRFVAAATPRLLGPRFRGGDEWGMDPRHEPADTQTT